MSRPRRIPFEEAAVGHYEFEVEFDREFGGAGRVRMELHSLVRNAKRPTQFFVKIELRDGSRPPLYLKLRARTLEKAKDQFGRYCIERLAARTRAAEAACRWLNDVFSPILQQLTKEEEE